MVENRPSLLNGPRNIRALQRAAGSLLNLDAAQDVGRVLGPHKDVWAEVITTKRGRSARVTLMDPARYGFAKFSAIEIRNVQDAAPRFIATLNTSYENTTMDQADITDREQQLEIAGVIATIVFAGAKKIN